MRDILNETHTTNFGVDTVLDGRFGVCPSRQGTQQSAAPCLAPPAPPRPRATSTTRATRPARLPPAAAHGVPSHRGLGKGGCACLRGARVGRCLPGRLAGYIQGSVVTSSQQATPLARTPSARTEHQRHQTALHRTRLSCAGSSIVSAILSLGKPGEGLISARLSLVGAFASEGKCGLRASPSLANC
jgi:hypothetical protein